MPHRNNVNGMFECPMMKNIDNSKESYKSMKETREKKLRFYTMDQMLFMGSQIGV